MIVDKIKNGRKRQKCFTIYEYKIEQPTTSSSEV